METENKDLTSDAQDKQGSDDEFMYLFVYGALLSPDSMRQTFPSATFVMKADLPNYEAQFRIYSEKRQGGTPCIIEVPGQMVRGVIYSVREAEILKLEILEPVAERAHKRETFLVLGEDKEWHGADLYRAVAPVDPLTPSKNYLDDMIEGLKAHGLDPEYTEKWVAWRRSLD